MSGEARFSFTRFWEFLRRWLKYTVVGITGTAINAYLQRMEHSNGLDVSLLFPAQTFVLLWLSYYPNKWWGWADRRLSQRNNGRWGAKTLGTWMMGSGLYALLYHAADLPYRTVYITTLLIMGPIGFLVAHYWAMAERDKVRIM